ncbi:uncharacterized protein LOC131688669 isoform X3 [Topomyia yanbarensis]|uniref:uncharacterized protein LOC131688669 isoform X3 n=1 Tax=Topomyia yanbarensis TaxID=2498891 RepID=UPI00273BDC44|nr:uncharacterized protein LOC131688669 isoform X3 [Topomyia yanbarensis]
MFVLKVKVKSVLSMKIEIRNFFLLTIVTTLLNLVVISTGVSSDNFLKLDEFNSSPTRHNHRHHPSSEKQQQQPQKDNFILIDYLSDGEAERRISWNGIAGKETSIGDSSKTLSLWQMSDGRSFIQMIYTSDGLLMDCEYVRQKKLIKDFRNRFYDEIEQARSRNFSTNFGASKNHHSLVSDHDFREFLDNGIITSEMEDLHYNIQEFSGNQPSVPQSDAFGMRNLSYIRLDSEADIPKDLAKQLNYRRLKHQCDQRHVHMRDIAQRLQSSDAQEKQTAEQSLQRHKRAIADWFLSPNTKWCGKGHSAERYHQLGGASRADMCCRQHDYCKLYIPAMATKWDLFNYRPYTISHCSCDQRQRRDLASMLRVPGTKWCGKGWSARNYVEIGGLSKADRCCRQHDLSCPFWILGFETKYQLFNWRVNTLMHCSCDERFRTCLKMADSSDANMVGKLFFNIVQSKCFVLKPETVCTKLSWWAKCEKKVRRKRAHIRDNRKY